MQTAVYGSGYLGTVLSACLADFGLPVTCFDENGQRVGALAREEVPYFEKNLKDVVRRNVRAGRLSYSTDVQRPLSRARVVFIAEDTSLTVEDTAMRLAKLGRDDQILVISTPVPVGTAARIDKRVRELGLKTTIVSHPIFVTDGCAVEDFNWPDRILLGTTSTQAVNEIKSVYRPLVMRGVPVIVTNYQTAELAREASTAYLATKISFINELASLCEHVNADAVDLALALGLDKKISPRCLQPGAGFGGAFVEAEMESLSQLAANSGVSLKVLAAAREVNRSLCDRIVEKISGALETLEGKQLALLGLAFKPNTNSVASSSSILLAKKLLNCGAKIRAYDPAALEDARHELNGSVQYCDSAYAAAEGGDALVVSTGWPEFRMLDYDRIRKSLRRAVIVDTKNILDATRLRSLGFKYVGLGRGA
jgi:UDPglucose 6-dehydrogenase